MSQHNGWNLEQHLQAHAGDYFAAFRGVPVEVQRTHYRQRINSTLAEFELRAPGVRQTVFVKTPRRRGAGSSHTLRIDRPRLFPLPPLDQKSRFEYLTLTSIERQVAELADDRFAAVRMLDLLPDGSAVVMEKAGGTSLRNLLRRATRLSLRSREELGRSLRNTGAWLKSFHGFAPLPHTAPRSGTRDEFLEVTDAFLEYLGEGSRRELCRSLQRAIHAAAAEALPEQLPCGLNHGDFAPWNVLVDRGGRVQVIDTLGKWTAPIYEDLARFLFGVELSPQQIWTGGQLVGTAELQWIRHQFWSGYFGAEPVPVRAIRLFECQMTLERWVALEYASRTARRWRRWIKNARTWMWELYVRPQLRAAVREWEQPSPRETFQKDAHHACTN